MSYRTIVISWLPESRSSWQTFSLARRESARLWGDLVERHFRLRRAGWKWPSKARWQVWAKRKYPNLNSQSVQQIIGEFCEAVESARQLRKRGHSEARYPWRRPEYGDVVYTNQAARIRDNKLILPNGSAGYLSIRIPKTVSLPGRLMEVRLKFGEVQLVCEVEDQPRETGPTIGVDLGVNTLIAATDGEKCLCVSGREAKATVQWRNKRLASLSSMQSKREKGSKRWKRLQSRKRKLLGKASRRVKDITHKATRKIADEFPNAKCYVGESFNDAAQKMGRVQAQQVSQACNRKIIQQLDYRTSGAIAINESYSSQTCPVCGVRNKCRRVYLCKSCGHRAPRDTVGSGNIRVKGIHGVFVPGCGVPNTVVWVHPIKYPGLSLPGSSPGHGACSSVIRESDSS